jgi:hypothetical protein
MQSIYVLRNDSVDNLVKNLELLSNPTNASIELVKPSAYDASTWYFKYTPNSDFYQDLDEDESDTVTFTYRITDADGDKDTAAVTITITGLNDDRGRSANVKELINLNYKNPTIKSYAEKGGDYDYLHIRTGHFYVKDIDVDDSITLETNNYIIDGYLGKFTPTFKGIKTDGKYLVTWKYEVNDSKLEPLTTPTTGTHSKDQTYTLKFKSGTDTLTADVVIHLDGRDEIEFGDDDAGNNVFVGGDKREDKFSNPGNDVLYLRDSSAIGYAMDGSDVIYGGNRSGAFFF